MILSRRAAVLASVLMGFVCVSACDDSSDGDASSFASGIGDPCTCENLTDEEACALFSIPIPSPDPEKAKIAGCEAVDMTGIEGGKIVCLRTISKEYKAFAPTVYAPKGYCTISAVGAEMDNDAFKAMTEYGEISSFKACPSGSAMLESKFDYSIMGNAAKITNKTCVKLCDSDADCNTDGDMTCLEKKGVKFCYHETNLSLSDDYTITPF